jgi:hypothetical protein
VPFGSALHAIAGAFVLSGNANRGVIVLAGHPPTTRDQKPQSVRRDRVWVGTLMRFAAFPAHVLQDAPQLWNLELRHRVRMLCAHHIHTVHTHTSICIAVCARACALRVPCAAPQARAKITSSGSLRFTSAGEVHVLVTCRRNRSSSRFR